MKKYLAVSVLIAAFAAGAGYLVTRPAADQSSFAAAFAQEAAEVDTSTIVEMAIGDPDAPLTVVEYASFTCPHCANFHETVFDELKENYIDTGKIRFINREVYFDRYGLWASMVARCGGEMRYFGISGMIYEQQQEWARGEPAAIAENLRRIGRTAGLSNDQLDACLSDAGKAQTLVAWYQENAEADGIESTPSFIVDGEKYGNMSYESFARLLDEKLAD